MSRKQKDGILRGCIYGCAGFTVLILVVIIVVVIVVLVVRRTRKAKVVKKAVKVLR